MKKFALAILLSSFCFLAGAQTVIFLGPIGIGKGNSLNVLTVEPILSMAPNPIGPSVFNAPNDHLIPDYVRENPMNYSYLCRLEQQIEAKLPVGLWLKLEPNNFRQPSLPSPGNAYIRMKMIRF